MLLKWICYSVPFVARDAEEKEEKKDPARLAAGSSSVGAMSYPGLSEYHIVCKNATAIFTLYRGVCHLMASLPWYSGV